MRSILIVDDNAQWQELIGAVFDDLYECDFATSYDEAKSLVDLKSYHVICLNWNLGNVNNARKLLALLRKDYLDIPVVLITGEMGGSHRAVSNNIEKLKVRNPNIKEVLLKGSEANGHDFVESLLETIPDLLVDAPSRIEVESEVDYDHNDKTIAWLHLSDLHIGHNNNGQDWKKLKKALLEDIQKHQVESKHQPKNCAGVKFQPDLIFITGDVAYRASESEYSDAGSVLESIWQITGMGKERTFVVPGNHDVERVAVQDDVVYESAYDGISNVHSNASEWAGVVSRWWNNKAFVDLINKKFKNYVRFVNNYTSHADKDLHYIHSELIKNVQLNIIGLNSSLLSWKDGEDQERGLCIGHHQIDDVEQDLDNKAVLNIGLVHHPEESLHFHEPAWKFLEKTCDVLLHGHLHELRVISKAEPGREHILLPGGSVHQDGVWHHQRYSYCVFDSETGILDIYMRMTTAGNTPVYVCDTHTYPEYTERNGCLRRSIEV